MAECNSRTAKRILSYLVKHQKLAQEEDYNYLNRIKRKLGMSPQAVSDGLNVLIEMGVISDVEKQGRKKIIYVTPGVVDQAQIQEQEQKKSIGQLV